MSKKQTTTGFDALSVPAELCSLLAKHEIVTPTPIQAEAIPVALLGGDLIGIAQTGTGKTLAFGLPMAANLNEGEVGLVLAPTRELAQQIAETYYKLNIKCVLIVGGAAMGAQISLLRLKHNVIVATPGRLIDHMDRGTANLDRVKIVVLDEADRMLDMGFAPAIERIMQRVPTDRQTMLFSATMPREIEALADNYLNDPARVEIEATNVTPDLIDQSLIFAPFDAKYPVLNKILDKHDGSVLVFTRTKHGARKAAKAIRDMGHSAVEIHSDRTLAQRRTAMAGFKKGDYRILVATDIASRGIDVKDIELVVNYDLPDNPEDYIHRIGRTGRAGSTGRAITIALPQQKRLLRDIQQLIGMEIPLHDPNAEGNNSPEIEQPVKCEVGAPMARNEDSSNHRPERPRYQNDRNDRPAPRDRREGGGGYGRPAPREDRPRFERRDDSREQRPRYDNDRPARPANDRPYPQDRRDGQGDNRGGYEKPRYGRDERPERRFEPRQDGDRPNSRFEGRRDDDRPRYQHGDRPYQNRDRRDERPPYERNDRNRDDRPRYQQGDRPYQNRDQRDDRNGGYRDRDSRPPYERNDRNRDDRPRYQQGDRPYQNRDQRDDRSGGYRDRYSRPPYERNDRNRGDRPYQNRDRQDGRSGGYRDDRPRFGNDREERPRFERRNDDRPAPRDRRDEKPRYGQDRPYERKDNRFDEKPPRREYDRDQKPSGQRKPKPQAKPRTSTAPTGFYGKQTNKEAGDRFTPKKFKVRVKPKHAGRKRK